MATPALALLAFCIICSNLNVATSSNVDVFCSHLNTTRFQGVALLNNSVAVIVDEHVFNLSASLFNANHRQWHLSGDQIKHYETWRQQLAETFPRSSLPTEATLLQVVFFTAHSDQIVAHLLFQTGQSLHQRVVRLDGRFVSQPTDVAPGSYGLLSDATGGRGLLLYGNNGQICYAFTEHPMPLTSPSQIPSQSCTRFTFSINNNNLVDSIDRLNSQRRLPAFGYILGDDVHLWSADADTVLIFPLDEVGRSPIQLKAAVPLRQYWGCAKEQTGNVRLTVSDSTMAVSTASKSTTDSLHWVIVGVTSGCLLLLFLVSLVLYCVFCRKSTVAAVVTKKKSISKSKTQSTSSSSTSTSKTKTKVQLSKKRKTPTSAVSKNSKTTTSSGVSPASKDSHLDSGQSKKTAAHSGIGLFSSSDSDSLRPIRINPPSTLSGLCFSTAGFSTAPSMAPLGPKSSIATHKSSTAGAEESRGFSVTDTDSQTSTMSRLH